MVAPACDPGQGGRASFVSRRFDLDTADSSPILHISAQGLYRTFVNGQRIGNDLLTPGWTCYDNRLAYQSYDLSGHAVAGENAIVIWLADGWFRSPIMWRSSEITNCWGKRVGTIAEVELDGNVVLTTDTDWRSGLLPVTRSGIYYGEDYDARLETLKESHGVDAIDFDISRLVPHEIAPVRELAPIPPRRSWSDAEGRMILDFGQNVAGYVRYRVRGEAGSTVQVEHSEVLDPDGALDNRNYRGARGATRYTLKGDGEESYAPSFTWMGYRYARISVEGQAEVDAITSVPISSVPEAAGGFVCAVPAVNTLVDNTIWSQRANFIEVPTDCPQRDERLGWTGDVQVFAGTACWLADCERFLRKFLRDVRHDQRDNGAISHVSPDPTRLHPQRFDGDWAGSTGWGDVITILPWQLYLHYGRTEVLHESLPAMVRWIDYLWSVSDGPIIRPSPTWGKRGFTFGDWLQPRGNNHKPQPTIADDCVATLYHFISTDLVARIAGIVGDHATAQRAGERADAIRQAFEHEYFSASGRLAHNDQTSYALAFLHDLVPARHVGAAKDYFRRVIEDADYCIGTGFVGTPALLPALTKCGMADIAEKMLLNRRMPGWLYQVDRGATTVWERWDAIRPDGTLQDPVMNSFNHYAYGAVCQWLFEDVAGVKPTEDGPGFDSVRIRPTVLPKLGHVAMWHDCRHGRIEAGWRIEGNRVAYSLTLPPGAAGVIPSGAFSGLTLHGQPLEIPRVGLKLAAGAHVIGFDLEQP